MNNNTTEPADITTQTSASLPADIRLPSAARMLGNLQTGNDGFSYLHASQRDAPLGCPIYTSFSIHICYQI